MNPIFTKILLTSKSSHEAIRSLYFMGKQESEIKSVAWYCKKAGIASRGYLWDAMEGRRTLSVKYAKGLGAAFGLKGAQGKYFEALVTLDSEKSAERKVAAREDLAKYAKGMSMVDLSEEETYSFLSEPYVPEIFCALSLFSEPPALIDLQKLFKNRVDVANAVDVLIRERLVIRKSGKLLATDRQIIVSSDRKAMMKEFVKNSIKNAITQVDPWYGKNQDAFFGAYLMSVKMSKFREFVTSLRDFCNTCQSDLEDANGDALVRMNVQTYPIIDMSR